MGLTSIPQLKKPHLFVCWIHCTIKVCITLLVAYFRRYVMNVFLNGFENVSHHLFWLLVPHLTEGNGFVCLFWVFHPYRELFTNMQTSSLPVKDCKFLLCSALIDLWPITCELQDLHYNERFLFWSSIFVLQTFLSNNH